MSKRERSFMIRLSMLIGLVVGTLLSSWRLVLLVFLLFLLLSVYDATKERRDQ